MWEQWSRHQQDTSAVQGTESNTNMRCFCPPVLKVVGNLHPPVWLTPNYFQGPLFPTVHLLSALPGPPRPFFFSVPSFSSFPGVQNYSPDLAHSTVPRRHLGIKKMQSPPILGLACPSLTEHRGEVNSGILLALQGERPQFGLDTVPATCG